MVIARSERGQKVFKEAISAGAIEYQRARDDDAVRSQYKMLVRKKCGIASNMLLAKMIGRGAPQYDNIETRLVLSSILLQVKEQLLQDEYFDTEMLFTSPSGDGVKWIIRIDLSKATHQDYFKAITNYLKQQHKIEVDQSGKDVSRACFLSHDPDAFLHKRHRNND